MATGTVILPVQAVKLPSSNPAAIDGGETNWRLLFDATTDESCWWQFRMPENYSSTPVAKIQFSMNTTQTGTLAVGWEVYVMAVAPEAAADINTESYATVNNTSFTLANNQTAGYLKECSITLTNADSAAAGNYVKIKLARDADGSGVTDSATGDAEVVAFTLQYTTT